MKKINLEMIGLKENGIFLIFLSIILIAFTRDIKLFFSLLFSILTIFYIPGYASTFLLLKDWNIFERIIIAPFIGLGITPAIAYILSALGFKGASSVVSIIICLISLILIIYLAMEHEEDKKEKEQ